MEFFKTPIEKHTCNIRVIVNPGQPQLYRIQRYLNGNMAIYFNIQNPDYDLDLMIRLLEDDFIFKTRYNVIFNWSNTPSNVIDNMRFREKITKLLKPNKSKNAPRVSTDLNTMVECVWLHMCNHQNHPDMKKYYLPKQLLKIQNYIKTILNKQIPKETVMEIAKKIIEKDIE